MVIHKDIRPRNHLSVKFSPHRFSPTGIGNRQMQTVAMQIMPETGSYDMPQRISKVMRHHLRLTGSSRCKIHQRGILIGIRMLRLYKRSRIFHSLMKVFETFGNFGTDTDQLLYRRRIGHRFYDMLGNHIFACRNNHLNIGSITTVHNIFLGQ